MKKFTNNLDRRILRIHWKKEPAINCWTSSKQTSKSRRLTQSPIIVLREICPHECLYLYDRRQLKKKQNHEKRLKSQSPPRSQDKSRDSFKTTHVYNNKILRYLRKAVSVSNICSLPNASLSTIESIPLKCKTKITTRRTRSWRRIKYFKPWQRNRHCYEELPIFLYTSYVASIFLNLPVTWSKILKEDIQAPIMTVLNNCFKYRSRKRSKTAIKPYLYLNDSWKLFGHKLFSFIERFLSQISSPMSLKSHYRRFVCLKVNLPAMFSSLIWYDGL